MVRPLQPIVACLMLALMVATPAIASTRSGAFGVSVNVVARTWIEPVDEPATILLTQADLAQRYKVIDVWYRVHTVGTSRYLLNIAPRTGLAEWLDVEGLGAPVRLGPTDITVLQYAEADVNELRLRLRLELRSGLSAGYHALPVRLSVSAS
jgi:hypothetical protein